MIFVIDYDAGNIRSVINVLNHFDTVFTLVNEPSKIYEADGIILPGVGSFGAAMSSLKKNGLDKAIVSAAKKGVPLFGICLGLQMLFEKSEESEGVKGLNLIKGEVKKLRCKGLKLPHIGWTSLENCDGKLLINSNRDDYYYFVHSYGVECSDSAAKKCKAVYGTSFDAYVEKDNIFGCQFHPEKSGTAGLKVVKSFLDLCKKSIEKRKKQ